MLDGRGNVRITDFGLAATAEELTAEDARGHASLPGARAAGRTAPFGTERPVRARVGAVRAV
jgi:hypothetical protein